jgi:four helix bundle protein
MAYKFEQLEVWQRALDYADQIYDIAEKLPKHERYNLADQMTRAANSIPLNIAAQDYFLCRQQSAAGRRGLYRVE